MLDETNRRAAVDLSIRTGSGTVYRMRAGNWLGNLDSNQDKQSQSLLCYRYTIPHGSD